MDNRPVRPFIFILNAEKLGKSPVSVLAGVTLEGGWDEEGNSLVRSSTQSTSLTKSEAYDFFSQSPYCLADDEDN